MKVRIQVALGLCVMLTLLATFPGLGQSGFWLNNGEVNAPVYDAQGMPLSGANYLAELWGGNTPDSLTPALAYYSRQRVIVPFVSPGGPGYFLDTYAGRDQADHPTVLSVPASGMAWLEVRAWDLRLGATYESVAVLGLGGYGESLPFYANGIDPLDLLSPPAPLIGLQSFSLRPIPEPDAAGLLLLGALLLLLRKHVRSFSTCQTSR